MSQVDKRFDKLLLKGYFSDRAKAGDTGILFVEPGLPEVRAGAHMPIGNIFMPTRGKKYKK